jgi:hypothetical protein
VVTHTWALWNGLQGTSRTKCTFATDEERPDRIRLCEKESVMSSTASADVCCWLGLDSTRRMVESVVFIAEAL